ncbi:MAG: sulfur carrier protein ThiS [Chloroflexia bacterium]|nr:sulfur carrier protein ThiS [Chloroflexia bacterium]
MKLIVNRKERVVEIETPTVQMLVSDKAESERSLAIAVNGDIVPKQEWASRTLKEGDEVDIVRAVSGGDHLTADDPLEIAGVRFGSRLFLGTGKYPDNSSMAAALDAAGTEMVTVAIRYMDLDGPANGQEGILDSLDLSRYRLLPNTAGAYTVDDAVKMARLARAATGTNWIKLEVIGDAATLWPDVTGTIEATKILVEEGFVVLPYTSPDLAAAIRLQEAGAATVMPLASPIGSGQGVQDWVSIKRIVDAVTVPVVVDAGIGTASDAALAMELGADAVLVNTAVARADDPVRMARAMRLGTEAGRLAYLAGRMPRSVGAQASSPTVGVPVATGTAADRVE